jgi:hypothetical protein
MVAYLSIGFGHLPFYLIRVDCFGRGPWRDLFNTHSKTKLILGFFLNRPVPHLWAASRYEDIRES